MLQLVTYGAGRSPAEDIFGSEMFWNLFCSFIGCVMLAIFESGSNENLRGT